MSEQHLPTIEGMSEYEAAQFYRKRSLAMETVVTLVFEKISETQIALGAALDNIRTTDKKFGVPAVSDPLAELTREARQAVETVYPETKNMTDAELYAFLKNRSGGNAGG